MLYQSYKANSTRNIGRIYTRDELSIWDKLAVWKD